MSAGGRLLALGVEVACGTVGLHISDTVLGHVIVLAEQLSIRWGEGVNEARVYLLNIC